MYVQHPEALQKGLGRGEAGDREQVVVLVHIVPQNPVLIVKAITLFDKGVTGRNLPKSSARGFFSSRKRLEVYRIVLLMDLLCATAREGESRKR